MTTAPLLVPSLVLAAVLVVSGLAKVRAPDATADAVVSLRLPTLLVAARVPSLLPWAELGLAAALVLAPQPAYAAAAALTLVLLGGYLVVIARALRFPEPVTCACFGRLSPGQVTAVTLARNVLLVLLAVAALVDAGRDDAVLPRLATLGATDWAWLGMVAAAALLAGLVVHGGRDPRQDGPSGRADATAEDYLRSPIPDAALVTLDGDSVTLRELARDRDRLLVFVNLGCGSCLRVIDRLPAFVAATPELATHAVIGTPEAAEQLPGGLAPLLDPGQAVQGLFEVRTPAAVLLGADGRLAAGPVVGFSAVTDLLAGIVDQLAERRLP